MDNNDLRTEELYEAIKDASKDGKISCAAAQKLADRLGVPYGQVGKAADDLSIKIHQCQLGCF